MQSLKLHNSQSTWKLLPRLRASRHASPWSFRALLQIPGAGCIAPQLINITDAYVQGTKVGPSQMGVLENIHSLRHQPHHCIPPLYHCALNSPMHIAC